MSESPECGPDGAVPSEAMERGSRPPGLLALPSYLASHVGRIGHDALVASVGEYDLRLPHFATLTALADFGPLPQHVLAERLGFQRSHLGATSTSSRSAAWCTGPGTRRTGGGRWSV